MAHGYRTLPVLLDGRLTLSQRRQAGPAVPPAVPHQSPLFREKFEGLVEDLGP